MANTKFFDKLLIGRTELGQRDYNGLAFHGQANRAIAHDGRVLGRFGHRHSRSTFRLRDEVFKSNQFRLDGATIQARPLSLLTQDDVRDSASDGLIFALRWSNVRLNFLRAIDVSRHKCRRGFRSLRMQTREKTEAE